jgi:hypothetical protein
MSSSFAAWSNPNVSIGRPPFAVLVAVENLIDVKPRLKMLSVDNCKALKE